MDRIMIYYLIIVYMFVLNKLLHLSLYYMPHTAIPNELVSEHIEVPFALTAHLDFIHTYIVGITPASQYRQSLNTV